MGRVMKGVYQEKEEAACGMKVNNKWMNIVVARLAELSWVWFPENICLVFILNYNIKQMKDQTSILIMTFNKT